MSEFHIRYYKFKVSLKIFVTDLIIEVLFLQGHKEISNLKHTSMMKKMYYRHKSIKSC